MKLAEFTLTPGIQASTRLTGRMLVELGTFLQENPEKAIAVAEVTRRIKDIGNVLSMLVANKVIPVLSENQHDDEFVAEVNEYLKGLSTVLKSSLEEDLQRAITEVFAANPGTIEGKYWNG